jgi:hypothetical protein
MVVVGIVSVLIGSVFDEGYPVPRELAIGGGPSNLLLTIGINVGVLVLFVGIVLSVYGNLLRIRWEAEVAAEGEESRAATDGGEPVDGAGSTDEGGSVGDGASAGRGERDDG